MECTMAMAYAMALPGSLDKASAAVGIEQRKDAVGGRIMLQLSQPKTDEPLTWYEPADYPEKFAALYAYCKQDVEVERALYKRLLPLSPSEREMWLLDMRINQRGILVDRSAVHKAVRIVESETARLDKEMREVTGNQVATCTATAQLTQWLRYRGLKLEGVAKSDVTSLLSDDKLEPDCRRALELRQEAAKSSTAKLETMVSRACSDGRIRGTLQYHGAATGRWAGRGLQTHNFPRGTLSHSDIDGVFGLLDKMNMGDSG
jgi:DNA polymerase